MHARLIFAVAVVVATELSNLNIHSSRLEQQLGPASSRAGQLSLELSQLQDEVRRRREEKARNAPQKVGQMKSELEKLNKELEVMGQSIASWTGCDIHSDASVELNAGAVF